MNNKSCLSNLLEFLKLNSKYKGVPVHVIYLDFEKASDTVPHRRPVYKVSDTGINDLVAQWIGNWLDGSKQRVVINGECSDFGVE